MRKTKVIIVKPIATSSRKCPFRVFESARKFVRNLKLQNVTEWRAYCKSRQKPIDIPSNPWEYYKDKGWKNLGDWLGTNAISKRDCQFKDFKQARTFAHFLGFSSQMDWITYCKSKKKPHDIPAAPNYVYKNAGWKSWPDWLGTNRVTSQNYRMFEDARGFSRMLGLKSYKEWRGYCKSEQKPRDIPSHPDRIYTEWKNWGDWLGTETVASNRIHFRKFEDARSYVRKIGLKNLSEWRTYCKSGNKPKDIPANPDVVYKKHGWEGLGDWIGTTYIANRKRQYRSFEDARQHIRLMNFISRQEYCNSKLIPHDIPKAPSSVYKDAGWKSWPDWIGTPSRWKCRHIRIGG